MASAQTAPALAGETGPWENHARRVNRAMVASESDTRGTANA